MTRRNSFSINFEKKGLIAKAKLLVTLNDAVIIVTGFKPFGGKGKNNSEAVAKKVHRKLTEINICAKLCIVDVIWDEIEKILTDQLEKHPEKKIICISVGEGTTNYHLETVGRNARAMIRDENNQYPDRNAAGDVPLNNPSAPDGDSILCSYSVIEVLKHFKSKNATLVESEDAGRYICDSAVYKLHSLHAKGDIHLGIFIHVPSYPGKQGIPVSDHEQKLETFEINRSVFVDTITKYLVSEALKLN